MTVLDKKYNESFLVRVEWNEAEDYSHSGLIKEIFKQLIKQGWATRKELEEEWEECITTKAYRSTTR